MSVFDYSPIPSNNTQISGITVAEGWAPDDVNDAFRQMMADIAKASRGGSAALADGVASDGAALAALGAVPYTLSYGIFHITADTTLPGHIIMTGAKFLIDTGVTLTITGSISAPPYNIFTGGGTVDLSNSSTLEGYPEWWPGCVTNDGTADCGPAIMACFTACKNTRLQRADYYTADMVQFNLSQRRIYCPGIPAHYATGQGARIICKNGQATSAILVGPKGTPANLNPSTFVSEMTVEGIVGLVVGANPPPLGQQVSGVASFDIRYVRTVDIRNCIGAETFVAFRYYGTTGLTFDRCAAFRSASTGTDNDCFMGFCDPGGDPVLAGDNASTRFIEVSVTIGGNPALPGGCVAWYTCEEFTDTFIKGLETSGCRDGVVVDGKEYNGKTAATQANLTATGLVLDTCQRYGILITRTNQASRITIVDYYVGLLGFNPASFVDDPDNPYSTTTNNIPAASMRLFQTSGSVSATAGRLLGSGNAPAIDLDACNGFDCTATTADDCGLPLYIRNGSTNYDIRMTAENPNNTALLGTVAVPAAYLKNTARGDVALTVKGKPNAFTAGVLAETSCDLLGIAARRINPSCIAANASGVPNKVQIGTVTITAPGWYTNAGAAGAAGQGHEVTGAISATEA